MAAAEKWEGVQQTAASGPTPRRPPSARASLSACPAQHVPALGPVVETLVEAEEASPGAWGLARAWARRLVLAPLLVLIWAGKSPARLVGAAKTRAPGVAALELQELASELVQADCPDPAASVMAVEMEPQPCGSEAACEQTCHWSLAETEAACSRGPRKKAQAALRVVAGCLTPAAPQKNWPKPLTSA